ncbi:LysR family transcriptional regulator [Paraburkholderia heleia]|uniref:LysR family transcriptional regulator n=1 Tax=Paraburkholderia heleia TaxID=634127 RepID=UPI002ADD7E39|nr:LysR family transcriptional regulator [Paraburkholderia heleia]
MGLSGPTCVSRSLSEAASIEILQAKDSHISAPGAVEVEAGMNCRSRGPVRRTDGVRAIANLRLHTVVKRYDVHQRRTISVREISFLATGKLEWGVDYWNQLRLFIQIAETGSMSRAAEALGQSNAAASRYLAELERRLSVRLVERNTRRLWLTESGEAFYTRCKSAVAEIEEAETAAAAATAHVAGNLRVTGPLSFCMIHIGPLLPLFRQRYPDVIVEVIAANRYDNIIDSGIDVAFRTRYAEPDSSITVRRLARTSRAIVASPSYLARRGTPTHPDDLDEHDFLTYLHTTYPKDLHFERDGETITKTIRGVASANEAQILRQAALGGLGMLVQPNYLHYDDVRAGSLVRVLRDWKLPSIDINIAYPSSSYLPARSRAFIDFVIEHFRAMKFEQKWTDRFAEAGS